MSDKLTLQEKTTISYYDDNASEWSKKHSGGIMFDEDMQELFKLVKNGKILEVGAGQGEDAQKLINFYGVENYTGVEPAAGLLNLAIKNNPGANFVKDTIHTMNFSLEYFDVFWICAMLIHVHKNKLKTALDNLNSFMKKGSYGFMSVMEGSADMVESRPGRYYSLWKQDEFEDVLKTTGFSVYRKRVITPERGSPWLAYIAHKE